MTSRSPIKTVTGMLMRRKSSSVSTVGGIISRRNGRQLIKFSTISSTLGSDVALGVADSHWAERRIRNGERRKLGVNILTKNWIVSGARVAAGVSSTRW